MMLKHADVSCCATTISRLRGMHQAFNPAWLTAQPTQG